MVERDEREGCKWRSQTKNLVLLFEDMPKESFRGGRQCSKANLENGKNDRMTMGNKSRGEAEHKII